MSKKFFVYVAEALGNLAQDIQKLSLGKADALFQLVCQRSTAAVFYQCPSSITEFLVKSMTQAGW